jgi:hypothetical protein
VKQPAGVHALERFFGANAGRSEGLHLKGPSGCTAGSVRLEEALALPLWYGIGIGLNLKKASQSCFALADVVQGTGRRLDPYFYRWFSIGYFSVYLVTAGRDGPMIAVV